MTEKMRVPGTAGMDLRNALNPRQEEAVRYCDGPLLVLAGAGSGKTKVLTSKIAHLVSQGVPRERILAVTFTNKAAAEMRDRVASLLGEGSGVWGKRSLQIGTFHAFGLRFLLRSGDVLEKRGFRRNFVIFDRNDTRSLVKELLAAQGNVPAGGQEKEDIGGILELFSRAKNEGDVRTLEPVGLRAAMRELFDAYTGALRAQGALDFDDLLRLPLHLLATDEEVLRRERGSLDWVLVDEYQDVNRLQYLLLRMLVGREGHIMVVGDPDQSIYGWRGADMRMILNFERDFPGAKVVVLDQNYRSSATILKAANAVIRNNNARKNKDLWTVRDGGNPLHLLLGDSERQEALFVAEETERLRNEGYRYGDVAVLYRMNALSRVYEQAFLEGGIPYRVVRGTAFYERKEIKDVLAFLRLAVNPRDRLSLFRVGNIPPRGLGKKGLESLAEILEKTREGDDAFLWERLEETGAGLRGKAGEGVRTLARHMRNLGERKNAVGEAIRYVMDDLEYAAFLRETEPENWEEREENVFELLSVIPSEGTLEEFLGEVALFTDLDRREDGSEDAVNLLTLHAAKGLEFPVVFLVGMEEGIFPHARCIEEENGIEEERRLCYVGMTRAEERLYLSGARSRVLFGTVQRNGFSRFLWEIPDECRTMENRKEESVHGGRRSDRRRWGW